jgi:hypothetical protein
MSLYNQYSYRLSGGLKSPKADRHRNMVMSPVGPGTKNYCAVEGQQQFTWTVLCVSIPLLGNGIVTRSHSNEELLEALFSIPSMSYQRKVGNKFFP